MVAATATATSRGGRVGARTFELVGAVVLAEQRSESSDVGPLGQVDVGVLVADLGVALVEGYLHS